MHRQVGGEVVVAAPQVLYERVPGGDGARGRQAFESAHRVQPGFEPAAMRLLIGMKSGGVPVSLAAGRGGLVGIRCDRPGQGAGSEAGWAGRCYALG